MATFDKGKPIETPDSTIEVTVDPTKPLPVGLHHFQLVVVDDSGNPSAAAVVDVIVKDTQLPTAVLEVVPKQPEFGKSFTLVGTRSSDVAPGKVARYIWTMLD